VVSSLAYPNLLGTKRLGCCCYSDKSNYNKIYDNFYFKKQMIKSNSQYLGVILCQRKTYHS
jgi:hypothetical protein